MTGKELSGIYEGIGHELKFWKRFVQSARFLTQWVEPIVTPELGGAIANFIQTNLPDNGRVLDCGSGVVSILHGLVPQERLVATDPLAEMYECIFDYSHYNIKPCLPTPAEALPYENEFDIVHMRNALDHSQNPVLVLERLFAACKPGGHVIIHGFENEANAEDWKGFHQWNIKAWTNNRLAITDKSGVTHYENKGCVWCKSEFIDGTNKTWFTWIAKK